MQLLSGPADGHGDFAPYSRGCGLRIGPRLGTNERDTAMGLATTTGCGPTLLMASTWYLIRKDWRAP